MEVKQHKRNALAAPNGLTHLEKLAIVVIVAIIAILAVPSIKELVHISQVHADERGQQQIVAAAMHYVMATNMSTNKNIAIETLIEQGFLQQEPGFYNQSHSPRHAVITFSINGVPTITLDADDVLVQGIQEGTPR
ncbi:hypothetical protein PaecuDRAFT_2756 [Paenibacillus curdlanolyticus YK9]|uniref:Uncharacterized protein n=1 Tax=Paenibacillus curdlanolyticus YK9 TaxID=717606 RepID=E0IB29_9BACL|nr:hypothetical protein [Paenibacillus curdlanolyticus]EFM10320.1 hypothetical protein PaecuDRAFT_2756 [Paenibacillus curdlanolyticus YK9]